MDFSKCVNIILKHEGGYVSHPKDPGGETAYGISKRAYPELAINELTREGAEAIYKRDYWDKFKVGEFPPYVRLILFDALVNQGPWCLKPLQKCLGVPADGLIGNGTISAASGLSDDAVVALVESFAQERLHRYMSLSTFPTFGAGWLKRLISVTVATLRS